MEETELAKLKEKLSYISKSKKGTFSCPLSFKFCYLEKQEAEENPWFILGNDVHDFIDTFFDIVEIKDGDMVGISTLKFHPNTPYKKNVAKFELERWRKIQEAGHDETFFFPTHKEKKWVTENPRLIGIVDRVHKCFRGDAFAPKHSQFKDGDLVIVENKTGKPTAAKCKGYEEDMLWYKLIMEIVHPELAPIRWGAIYFPYDNYIYHMELRNEDCRVLAKEIKKTREGIMQCLDTGMWPAKPSSSACMWCGYKSHCPSYKR